MRGIDSIDWGWLWWLALGGGGIAIGTLIQRFALRSGRSSPGASFKVNPVLDKGEQSLDKVSKEEESISVRLRPVKDLGTQTLQMDQTPLKESDDEQA